jgi:hypothetical protein
MNKNRGSSEGKREGDRRKDVGKAKKGHGIERDKETIHF